MLIISWSRYRLFKLENNERINELFKLIGSGWSSIASYDTGSVKPLGFIMGKYYFGYVHVTEGKEKATTVYILCTEDFLKNTEVKKVQEETAVTVPVYNRCGSFYDIYYTLRNVFPKQTVPRNEKQKNIVETIAKAYRKNSFCSAFVSGESGSGKSSIATLLAIELKGKLCYSFNPTDPGDTLAKFLSQAEPEKDSPIVFLIDEVDILYEKLKRCPTPHKYIQTSVTDKSSLNTFMDHLSENKNLIFLFTSNLTKEQIDTRYDPSYLREGRIDMYFELQN